MKKQRCILWALASLALAGCVLATAGRAEYSTDESLKGLKSVYVLVERTGPNEHKIGITDDILRTDAELKLRTAGMQVVDKTTSDLDAAMLYINVAVTDGLAAASLHVEIGQDVILRRDHDIALPTVTTWAMSYTFSKPSSEAIRNRVRDCTDAFLNAWLKANPKPR